MKNQLYGDGSVYETTIRGKLKYVAKVMVDGKQKREYYDTEKEAQLAKRRMLKERDNGALVQNNPLTEAPASYLSPC